MTTFLLLLAARLAAMTGTGDDYAAREAASRAASFEGGDTVYTSADIELLIFLIALPIYFVFWLLGIEVR